MVIRMKEIWSDLGKIPRETEGNDNPDEEDPYHLDVNNKPSVAEPR